MSANTNTQQRIAGALFGDKCLAVGPKGRFKTMSDAFEFINTQNRYRRIYSQGTITLTQNSKAATPSGGADFTDPLITDAINRSELWLYLESEGSFIPLQGVAPPLGSATPAVSFGDYAELKFNYLGASGAKSYQLIKPNWYHIILMPGVTEDPETLHCPLFTSITGVDRENSVFVGAITVDLSEPGFWAKNLTWLPYNGADTGGEEAFIGVTNTLTTEEGYAQVVLDSIDGGRGNPDRDVVYRVTGVSPRSHALFRSVNCDYYSHFDAIQCIARELFFALNNVYIHSQDNTVFNPTGFRWFSSHRAPDTDLNVLIDSNNFYIEANSNRNPAGIILLDDNVAYLSTPPDLYGRVTNNFIQVRADSGNAIGINSVPFLYSANAGRILVDGNTFDVTSVSGSTNDILTHASASPLVLGKNNVAKDGSSLSIGGAPFRLENHGKSAPITTGGTIAHGLRATPSKISLLPENSKSPVAAVVDDTNITITFGGGGATSFFWSAEL